MKVVVILSHSWSPFLALTSLYGKNEFLWVSVQPSGVFSREKNSLQITHANHMTMTTRGQILSWPDYRKTKENVNITLLDFTQYMPVSPHGIGYKQTWYPPDVR